MCAVDSFPREIGVDHVVPEFAVVSTCTCCGTFLFGESPGNPPGTRAPGSSITAKRPRCAGSAATNTLDPSGTVAATWRVQCAPSSVLVSKTAQGHVLPGAALAMYAAAS